MAKAVDGVFSEDPRVNPEATLITAISHREVIDRLLVFYGRRQDRIRELLREAPRSPWEVSRALFPAARPADAFLTVSETIANLEAMEARGEVRRELVDGVYRFR